ncbi:MAG: FAD-binding protein, partial [Methylophilaceae bacterium]|nr:FAD-binding protein [Methylophilaceae bacterium]
MNPRSVDTLIIGAGLAGLSLALALAETRQVCIAIKREATDSASQWAQGGIAMALGGSADLAAHFQDTINAGDGLCDEAVVADILSQSATVFEWLTQQGVRFTQDGSNYHLNREGGHNQRRIFHVADATGAAIQNLLITKAQSHPNILILSQHIAVDLITRRKLELAG